MRVEAYYNLHKKCLSYRPIGGKVRHALTLQMRDVKFAVQPAGRERVLLEGRKNVHAFVRGELISADETSRLEEVDVEAATDLLDDLGKRKVTYNPYKYDSFVYADTGERVDRAGQVAIIDRNIWQVA